MMACPDVPLISLIPLARHVHPGERLLHVLNASTGFLHMPSRSRHTVRNARIFSGGRNEFRNSR
jgi:hypothetical protein